MWQYIALGGSLPLAARFSREFACPECPLLMVGVIIAQIF